MDGPPALLCLSIVVLVPLVLGLLLFDGDLDLGGHYEVLQTVPYSPEKIAYEIERWDHQALGGLRYAVVVADHRPTTFELRRALHSFFIQPKAFDLADRSVSIRWSGAHLLLLRTEAPGTTPDWLMSQRPRIGDVQVQYSGRP